MKHFVFVALCFVCLISPAQEKYPKQVKKFLSQNHILDNEPLYLICINANDCVNCLLPLGDLLNDFNAKKINNVIYLIDGIDASEKNKYFQNILRLDTLKKKIFIDKNLYYSLNSDINTKIIVGQNGRIIYNEKIKDLPEDNRLKGLLSTSTQRLELVDSLNFSSDLLNGCYVSDLVNEYTLITLNTKYQEINSYNLKTNIKSKSSSNHTLDINVDSLLTLTINNKADSALLWYNIWLRHQKVNFFTKNPLFPDIDLINMVVQDKDIILTVGIPVFYPTYRTTDTTYMISKIPFLVTLTNDLSVKDIFSFSTESSVQPPAKYIPSLIFPFYLDIATNKVYFKTAFEGTGDEFKSAKNLMVCSLNNKKIKYNYLLNFQYPEFFQQKGYYNNYNNCSFSIINDVPYFFFTYTPNIYSLTTGKEYKIPNTQFELNEFNMQDPQKTVVRFKMQTLYPTIDGVGASYISENRTVTNVFFDKDWQKIATNSLPTKQVTRVIIRNNSLFILSENIETKKATFYQYSINK